MFKPILLPLLAALMLTACASGPTQMPAPTLNPPQDHMQDCPTLPPPQSAALTDLLTNHIAIAKAYHQCRDRHQGLINWLEKTREVR